MAMHQWIPSESRYLVRDAFQMSLPGHEFVPAQDACSDCCLLRHHATIRPMMLLAQFFCLPLLIMVQQDCLATASLHNHSLIDGA